MKKIILSALCFLGIGLIFNSCKGQKVVINREIETTKDGPMLLGFQSKDQFSKAPYADWYTKEHGEYQTDDTAIAELRKKKLNSYNITVVLGTWCEDSHREFPRLMKILEKAGYPEQKLTILAVNRKKESPSGEEGLLNIQKVPTIIVKKYGKEIGRIIEMPSSGWLERDLADILKKDDSSAIKDIFGK